MACIDLVSSKQSKLTDRQLISSRLFDDFGIGQSSGAPPANESISINRIFIRINITAYIRLSVHSSVCPSKRICFPILRHNYNTKLIMRVQKKEMYTIYIRLPEGMALRRKCTVNKLIPTAGNCSLSIPWQTAQAKKAHQKGKSTHTI